MSSLPSAFRFTLATLAVASLAACGGGRGGDATSSSSPPVSSAPAPAAPVAVAQPVNMTAMSLAVGDVLAQTTSNTTVVGSLLNLFDRFTTKALVVGNSYAGDGPTKINPGANFGFTNKVQNGKLVTLSIKLQTADGKPVTCDASTAEIKIHKIWGINPGKGHLMIKADAPSIVNSDCTVQYKTGIFAVTDTGKTIELIVDAGDDIIRVVEAGDEAANSSNKAVLVFSSGAIRTLDVVNDAAVLATLTNTALPLKILDFNPHTFAFDGTYLVGMPNDRTDAVLVFNTNDASFKIISNKMPAPGTPEVISSHYNYASAIFLTAEGEFIWHEMDRTSRKLNISERNYVAWAPAQEETLYGSRYGLRGRSGDWLMSDRCTTWNYKTGEQGYQMSVDGKLELWNGFMGGIYVNLEKGFGHCVSTNGAVFSRLELATMKRVNFDTDTLGIYFSANRKFEMFKDKAMLWDAVSATTGDVKIVELNFETGEMTDHGVVKTADRKVTTLISVGG